MTGVRITLDMILKAAKKSSLPEPKPIPKAEDLTGWLEDLVKTAEHKAPKAPPGKPPR